MSEDNKKSDISFFEKNLTLWVLLCMAIGILISKYIPFIPEALGKWEISNVSIPIAILLWFMIYPMMIKVDFNSLKEVGKSPKGLWLTLIINWAIKPFTMFLIASFFLYYAFASFIPEALARDYVAGAVLLGVAPCTAMVFVWSQLTKGNASYTVVQVAINDLLILVFFIPIVQFLLGINDLSIPFSTLLYSIIFFVLIPLTLGILTRQVIIKTKGEDYLKNVFLAKIEPLTIIGLLITLILIFSFQGNTIINNPWDILLISIPLIVQTVFIFYLAFIIAKKIKLPFSIAAPASFVGASNFFELAVAIAISSFGMSSPVVLATVVGVLIEVPLMLMLVNIANKNKSSFTTL